MLFNCYFT